MQHDADGGFRYEMPVQRDTARHQVLQFKFIVDGQWQCHPDLPTRVEDGVENNFVELASAQ